MPIDTELRYPKQYATIRGSRMAYIDVGEGDPHHPQTAQARGDQRQVVERRHFENLIGPAAGHVERDVRRREPLQGGDFGAE